MRTFHGTALAFAVGLIEGDELTERCARNKIDGPPGFFLATDPADAEFFAARRGTGAVIVVDIKEDALRTLTASGAVLRPIPSNLRAPFFRGSQLWIPPAAFAVFNAERSRGHIDVHT